MGGFIPLGFITVIFSSGVCAKPAKTAVPKITANAKQHARFFMPFLLFLFSTPIIPYWIGIAIGIEIGFSDYGISYRSCKFRLRF